MRVTPTVWRPCGPARWWSTTPARARSAVTGSCAGSSARTGPGWPSATPGSKPWHPRVSTGGPWWNCWRTWPTTERNWRGRWRSSPSLPTSGRWCSVPTAANGRSIDGATSGLPSSSPGTPTPVMSSAATRPRWTLVTPKRRSTPSPRTGTSASRSARRTPTAAPVSSARSSARASAQAAASASSTAPSPTTACAAPWNTTASAGAATRSRPRRESGSTNAARTDCWPRSASTTTSKHPSSTPEARAGVSFLPGAPSRHGGGAGGPPVPSVEARVVARGPGFAEPRRAQIPVRADLARRRAQVTPQVVDRRASPEPVAVVDAVHDQARLEHERVRDHRVVVGVGVLLDVKVLLDRPPGVGEEGPLGADRRAELLQLVVLVGGDRDDLGVRHRDLRLECRQLQVLLVLLRAVVAAGEREDQRVPALQLAELTDG